MRIRHAPFLGSEGMSMLSFFRVAEMTCLAQGDRVINIVLEISARKAYVKSYCQRNEPVFPKDPLFANLFLFDYVYFRRVFLACSTHDLDAIVKRFYISIPYP